MRSDETQMQVDSLKLSELYASFLAALGGVSITVLALVLKFNPKPEEEKFSRFGVAALFLATISCFIGAHLMAESAAFISKSKESNLGVRLSLLASINIYVAAMLLIFTIVLLTAEHIKWISGVIFLVLFITLKWMSHTATHRLEPEDPKAKTVVPLAIIAGVVIGGAIGYCAWSRWFPDEILLLVFVLPALSIACSFIDFVRVLNSEEQVCKVDLVNPASLIIKLRDGQDPLSTHLRHKFDSDAIRLLNQESALTRSEQKQLNNAMVKEFNQLLKGSLLYELASFPKVQVTEEARKLREQKPQGKNLVRLNRRLLEAAYPDEIARRLNVWRYSFAIALPCMSLCGAGIGLVLR